MPDYMISILVVAAFTLITLFIGLFGWAKKLDQSTQDYFVASRKLGFAALFFTYCATYHSASAFLGTGGLLYAHGISFWAIGPFTQALGGILMYVIGSRIWLLGKKYDYMTPGELLADYYDSPFLRILTGIVLATFIIPYVQVQLVGAGNITEAITFGTIPYAAGAFVLGLVIMLYVFLGGMRSVAWTDIFMGVFMFLAMVIGCWVLTNMIFGGSSNAWNVILENKPELLTLPGGGTYYTRSMAFSWVIIITLGNSVCAPTIIMRMFSANSLKTLKWVGILSPLYLIWIYISYIWFGLGTAAANPGLVNPDNMLPNALFRHLPVALAALICAGGLSAMLSTANSQLHSGSALLTRDVYIPLRKSITDQDTSDKKQVSVGRIAVVIIFVFSFWATLNRPALLSMIVSIATGGMVQIFPMIIGALFWPRATKRGAISGFVAGVIIMAGLTFRKTFILNMLPGFWALMINMILFVIISLTDKNVNIEKIMKFHGFLASDEAKSLIKDDQSKAMSSAAAKKRNSVPEARAPFHERSEFYE